MSTPETLSQRTRLGRVRLPKLSLPNKFRIRSTSKDRLQNFNKLAGNPSHGYSETMNNQKFRSSSLKTTQSRKSLSKKSEANHNSSEEDLAEAHSCKSYSKPNQIRSREQLERQHAINIKRLKQIAQVLDPKTIMKLGRKNSECSHEESSRNHSKNKNMREQLRINQYIFQGKQNRSKKAHKNKASEQEYWKKVNQSLILAPCKTAQDEVSKDLRQIFETLVTE